jgi:uncharacterized membrane protein
MATTYPGGSGSVAAIGGHPLHPMVVPIPIAAFLGVLASDLLFAFTGDPFWASASYWLLWVGVAGGAIAAALGVIELAGLSRARTMGLAWAHGIANALALIVSVANLALRMSGPDAILYAGLGMSAVVAALILFSGWLGGELAFRHGLGVAETVGAEVEDGNPDLTPAGNRDIGKA